MPKLSRNAPKSEKRRVARQEMEKFHEGTLHSGSESGPIVTKESQAKAIAMSVSGQDRYKRKKKRTHSRGGRRNARR